MVCGNFIKPYFVPQFIVTSYAGIEGRGMHKASKDVQVGMRKAKQKWDEYYILKMDVTKYFLNIDKKILWNILKRKIKETSHKNFYILSQYISFSVTFEDEHINLMLY